MTIRPLISSDYEILVEWGRFWRFPYPQKEFLPDNGLGGLMVCNDADQPVCAGYVYETNSSCCWMEWIISSPNVKDRNKRSSYLNALIQGLGDYARNKGFLQCFTVVKNENLINKYQNNGFNIGTEDSIEMMKIL